MGLDFINNPEECISNFGPPHGYGWEGYYTKPKKTKTTHLQKIIEETNRPFPECFETRKEVDWFGILEDLCSP